MKELYFMLAPLLSILSMLIAFFPLYALYCCVKNPMSFGWKVLHVLLMLVFWPLGIIPYAFTKSREIIVQAVAGVLVVVLVSSFLYAGEWRQSRKAGQSSSNDPRALAVVVSAAAVACLIRPYVWFLAATGKLGKDEGSGKGFTQGAKVKRTFSISSSGNQTTVTETREQNLLLNTGKPAVTFHLGAVSKEDQQELPADLKVVSDGGAELPLETGESSADDALIAASQNGDLEALKTALKDGARIDAVSSENYTALMEASQYGYTALVELLISQGADPAYQSPDGETALSLARQNFRKDIEELLKSKQ